ncbi:MAG: adaptor protein MecA [Lachnospiraceae bacterium]|jgi:adapter protein MecA 1/2|nr:adaptor protein MecA [Lachnospiraceae bacterium]
MKIERINDQQIRCTLTRKDLADRELKLSELAYGTEKTQNLFRDMMQQASYEFGFEAEDIPLMIEAIPLNGECIILIITKVEDPEELDTRFSKFAPSVHEESGTLEDLIETLTEGADEVLELFKKLHNSHLGQVIAESGAIASISEATDQGDRKIPTPASHELTRIYSFTTLQTVIHLSRILVNSYLGVNSLYKRKRDERYVLVITKGSISPADFNKICNVLSEYGTPEKTVSASEAYLEEHFEPLIRNTAIQDLALL